MARWPGLYETQFLSHVMPEPNSGCWLWLGARAFRDSARINYGHAQQTSAHRMAFHLFVGPIPAGLQVLHRCDFGLCVNPAHLFLGTQGDNMADCATKGRTRGRWNVLVTKTHCPQGHAYDAENTRWCGTSRGCKTCNRIGARAYQARKRAAAQP